MLRSMIMLDSYHITLSQKIATTVNIEALTTVYISDIIYLRISKFLDISKIFLTFLIYNNTNNTHLNIFYCMQTESKYHCNHHCYISFLSNFCICQIYWLRLRILISVDLMALIGVGSGVSIYLITIPFQVGFETSPS